MTKGKTRKKPRKRIKRRLYVGGVNNIKEIQSEYIQSPEEIHTNNAMSRKNFINLPCSPVVKYSKYVDKIKGAGCYPMTVLTTLRNYWNKYNPKDPIEANGSAQEIYAILKNKLMNKCNNEKCWATVLDPYNDYGVFFAPKRPAKWEKNIHTWLSTIDIWQVVKQYEQAFRYFKCIYPAPIDFDKLVKEVNVTCISDELCTFKLNSYLSKGYTKIGMVFNTDPHDKPGQHWIALFIDMPRGIIYFFDSAGDECPAEIMKLVSRIVFQSKELKKPLTFSQNYPMTHQYSTTECGMYVLYFIINMLLNKVTPEELSTIRIPDEKITNLRNSYFIPYDI